MTFTDDKLETETDRASDISFLQRPTGDITHTNEVTDVIYVKTDAPDTPIPIPANHQLKRFFPFSLRNNEVSKTLFPSPKGTDLVQFDESLHTAPTVLVLDTDGTSIATAHLATLTGKIIESFELDGSTIEMPNAMKSLGMQNCMFADSAIAYKYVRPGSYFLPRAENTLPPLARVAPNSRPRLPVASLLHDRTQIMLPRFEQMIHERGPFATLP